MKLIEQFNAGASVPEWLICLEPHDPKAKLGTLVFKTDAKVFEYQDQYLVFPADLNDFSPLMMLQDCLHITVRAGNRTVRLMTTAISFSADGTGQTIKYLGD